MSSSEWKTVKLIEIVDTQIDNRGRNPDKYLDYSDHPVIDNYLIKNQKYPDMSEVKRYINKDNFENFLRGYLKKDDVLITLVGNGIGNVTMAPSNKSVIVQNTIGLRTNKNASNTFLYYLLLFYQDEIKNFNRGTSQPSIKKTDLFNLAIQIPPLQEQKAIAHILSTLDDKIEVNNQINKTLENMAQAIFKQWFVDFEFPNENGEPYKSSGGEMVESELGMIPKGWRVDSLGNLLDVQKGLSYKGKHLVEEGVPMINLGTINPGGGYRQEKIKFYNGDFKDRHMVKPGDLVIANTDMTQDRVILGSPCLVPDFEYEKIIFTHHIFAIRNLKIPRNFLYYYFKSKDFRERAEGYATGTTVLALPQKGVVGIDLYLPNVDILERFNELIQSFIDKMNNLDKENELLKRIRDVLLPKLMSGEIRVSLDEEGDAS